MIQNQLLKSLRQFGISARLDPLSGGSQPIFRAGNIVLKQIDETCLENNHSPQLIRWIADFSSRLEMRGFRMPQAVKTIDGSWITDEGWTGWTFLEGRYATSQDVPLCIEGVTALQHALRGIPKHPLMDDNRTPWGKAHRWCWESRPAVVQPQLKPYVQKLYNLRQPIPSSPPQLIHGDLNPQNILIAPGLPPAFLDLSPFWAPAEFGLAIFANWIGPRQGDSTVLPQFEYIPHFKQLLIRAALRMLLIMAEIDYLAEWETCSEKYATELVIEYVTRE